MSDVIPLPAGRACAQQIGHIVDHFDDDLRAGVLGILREARDAGGDAVVARLLARLIVTIGMEFGDAVLDEPALCAITAVDALEQSPA
jgi:hypothetical protein